MWDRILSLFGFRTKPQMASLFESFTYPTMTELTKSTDLGLEYLGAYEDDGLEEDFQIVQFIGANGELTDFCVIGDVNYNHGYYLVCVERNELADSLETADQDEPPSDETILILQAFVGVGNDVVYHAIQNQELHNQVFEAFMIQEMPEEH